MDHDLDVLRHEQPPREGQLAEGSVVRLLPLVTFADDGALVLGGSPFTMLVINEAVKRRLERWRQPTTLSANIGEAALARRLEQSGFVAIERIETSPEALASITIVIPTHGRVDEVASLLGELHGEDIIVVDDGTELSGALELEAACHLHGARYVRHDEAKGPAAARNSGAALATREVVCFIDSDLTVPKGWKTTLLSHFVDPSVGAVAPRIGVVAESRRLSRYEQFSSPLDLGPVGGSVRPMTRLSYVPSAMLLVRQSLAARFDEALHIGEDVDFIWSLVESGWTVRYVPSVEALHPTRPTVATWLQQRLTYGRSAGPLAVRHPRALTPLSTSGWTAAFWLGVLVGLPVVCVSSLAMATALLSRRLTGRTETPRKLAFKTVVKGSVAAGPPLLRQVFRTYGVPLTAGAMLFKSFRRPVVLLIVIASLPRWWKQRQDLDPVSVIGLQVAEDLAYGAGVLTGSLDAKTRGAVRPSFTWFRSSLKNNA